MMRTIAVFLLPLLLIGLSGCGGSSSEDASSDAGNGSSGSPQVGPIETIDVGPIEEDLAEKGEEIFNTRCTTCHKLDEEHIGPTLRDVTNRRDPAYIMNMILAPEDMIQKHPTAQELFSEYGTMMTNQNLSEDQARAILEYLRKAGKQESASGS